MSGTIKFIDHLPDIGFRMIRYYGFLSNRLRSTLLPKVRKLLGQEAKITSTQSPSFAQLIFKNFGTNPLECILCNEQMRLTGSIFGKASAFELVRHHRQLALLKKIT